MKKKKKILVLAPNFPMFDRNSGDLRLYKILEILSKEFEITYCVRDRYADSDKYRDKLEKLNIIIEKDGAYRAGIKKLLRRKKYDMVFFEFYYSAINLIEKIRILNSRCIIVVDSVDVHFYRFRLKYELSKEHNDFKSYSETKKQEIEIYSKADAVITVTKEDANEIIKENKNIICKIIPNIHDIKISDKVAENEKLIFIGGFNHPPNVDAVIYFIKEIFPLIKEKKLKIKLIIVGNAPPVEIEKLKSECVEVTGYVPETSYYLHQSLISIAPLRYGAGMKGKIGEAMGHGIPVVTTSIGAQGMGIVNREHAMIANSPEAFADAVIELLEKKDLYNTIRNNGINLVKQKYSEKVVGENINNIMMDILNRPAKRLSLFEKFQFLKKYYNSDLCKNILKEKLGVTKQKKE